MSQADNLAALGSNVNASGVLQPAGGGTGTTTSTGTGSVVLSSGATLTNATINGAVASGFTMKNRIINGDMVINQRGATLSTTNSQGYFIDRMWGFSGSSTAATFSQQSSSGLAGFPFFARAQRTAGNTGTTGVYFGQIIESNNLQDLQGQSVTVSFWARAGANYSAGSSVLTVFLRTGTVADQGLNATISPGWTGQVDQTSNVTLTTSWQRFSTTFTVASNIQEMTTFFYNATSGTAGAADFFDVTGIQLERGSQATSFEWLPYGTELMLCQRYYEKSYDIDVVPATSNNNAGANTTLTLQFGVSWDIKYKVTKRATATITTYSPFNGATGNFSVNMSSNAAITGVLSSGLAGFSPYTGSSPGNVVNYIHWTASSEL